MPYNLVFHDQLSMPLDQCVLVVDEAHNIADAITGMHSATITSTQVIVILL